MSKTETKIKPRAKPHFGREASHRTESTRKYQCNAPIAWERYLKNGEAIREALYLGLVKLGHKVDDPRQLPLKGPKPPKAPKAPKAPKPKAPKASRSTTGGPAPESK